MHYVSCRSHRTQKHKFSLTSPSVLLVATAPVPLEDKK
jgi:hypothetical protein